MMKREFMWASTEWKWKGVANIYIQPCTPNFEYYMNYYKYLIYLHDIRAGFPYWNQQKNLFSSFNCQRRPQSIQTLSRHGFQGPAVPWTDTRREDFWMQTYWVPLLILTIHWDQGIKVCRYWLKDSIDKLVAKLLYLSYTPC